MYREEYGSGRMGIECLIQCLSSSVKTKALPRQAGAFSAGRGSTPSLPGSLQEEDWKYNRGIHG